MKFTRRDALASVAAFLALPVSAGAAVRRLRAETLTAQILPEGDGTTNLWGFNGTSPGPELRYRQGDRLQLVFENGLEEGTAVHWHGIRIKNEMDGVPYMTQPMVDPGSEFAYEFDLPDPGTYWYHAHNRSFEQVARGLYGPLIVEEENPPKVDHDITVVLDDWRIERTGEVIEDFGSNFDFSHGGRLGTFAKIIPSVAKVRQKDRIRLRLINAATARIFPLEISGFEGGVVALDGMPLPATEPLDSLMIAPAQRIDLIGDVTSDVAFDFRTRGEPYPLGSIIADGMNDNPATEDVEPLPPHTLPVPHEPFQTIVLKMEGGAMGGAHSGSGLWAFNGSSELGDVPLATLKGGSSTKIILQNETAFPHGIHLHGHHFFELETDGSLGALRDTTLIMRQQTREILCVFDNPGKWMLHCHMLGHQASGMKTWIEVV